jgi:hypothetical protein
LFKVKVRCYMSVLFSENPSVYLCFSVMNDGPSISDLREKVIHAFLPFSFAGLEAIGDVDEVLRSAVAYRLDRLKGRLKQTIGHLVSEKQQIIGF